MPGFDDVYTLAPTRAIEPIDRFLARFAPAREPSTDEYVIESGTGLDERVFGVDRDVISYCLANPSASQQVYWRCLGDGDPAHAMAFFMHDGGLILGLSVTDGTGGLWLTDMQRCLRSTVGCVRWEQPPPGSTAEFLEWCRG